MANLEVLSLDEATPQIRAPGSGDGYIMPRPVTISPGTLTTDIKVLDLAATWNDAAVTFTGFKLNITSTASAAASLFLDLQLGGTSKFYIDKSGNIKINENYPIIDAVYGLRIKTSGNSSLNAAEFTTGLNIRSDYRISFHSGINITSGGYDTALWRDAAGTFAQHLTTNAQTFRIYNTRTDASNYERLSIGWASNIVSIKPENAGTGSARVLHISGLPTSNPGPGILWNNGGTPAIGT